MLVANGTLGGQTVRVIKNGATTWNLTAANTYTGNTTVTAGTLLINGSTAGGAMLVNSGTLGGNGTVGGAATISSGATLSPGNSPGLMTFSSGLTMGANSTIIWELTGNTNGGRGTNFDGVNVTGALAIDPTTNSILDTTGGLLPGDGFWAVNRSWLVYDSATNVATGAPGGSITGSLVSGLSGLPGTFSWRNVAGDVFLNYTASAIPEPSSLLLTVLGIAGFGLRRSRKNRA